MNERNPLFKQISDLEDHIIDLNSGLQALGIVAQEAIERDRTADFSGLIFVERSLKAVHKSLRTQYYALRTAAGGAGDDDRTCPRPVENGGES